MHKRIKNDQILVPSTQKTNDERIIWGDGCIYDTSMIEAGSHNPDFMSNLRKWRPGIICFGPINHR